MIVTMVSLVQGKFPTHRRGDALELPAELLRDTLPSGDFHTQEERRLFYVGMMVRQASSMPSRRLTRPSRRPTVRARSIRAGGAHDPGVSAVPQ